MWSNDGSKESLGLIPGRQWLGPLLLMSITPLFAITLVDISHHEGSLTGLLYNLGTDPVQTVMNAWKTPSSTAIYALLIFAAFELLLMKIVPGKEFKGPVTPAGNVPVYKANGMQSFFITIATFIGLSSYGLNLFPADIVYTYYSEMICALCVFSFIFCGFLYIKGVFFPSSSDNGTSGNAVLDFYWGRELYPRVFGWDVKQFTNCRFGMMAWGIIPISFFAHSFAKGGNQINYAMAVNVIIQLIYVAKFFWWETGYLASIDIMHDRAGYYICWGCLVWVPSVYVSHSLFIAYMNPTITLTHAIIILGLGIYAVYLNYDADRQRVLVRKTNGDCLIWGEKPEIIRAEYVTEKGEKKKSILLTSGWWGVSRHFHYVPELMAAYFWSCPGGHAHFMPFFYVTFLFFLLLDRSFRDDKRCADKYGKYWKQYCDIVPFKIIPGIV